MRRLLVVATGLAAVAASGAVFAVADAKVDGAVVRTADGAVRGTVAADHRSFLGVPYAAPPVDDLRWRAPRPAEPWQGVRDATRPGPVCPQLGGGDEGERQVIGSEDCLSLNVQTPVAAGAAGRLPVMVFLHGGGFVNGSGATYDPSRVTAQGQVVSVTVNYRLGALGFLDHPSLPDPQAGNFGFADQQAALRWVRRNIAAFGGDPGNVTLWGQSAGAHSVCAQLAAPGARGLFHKVIAQSGPCGNDVLSRPVARRRAVSTARDLGCGVAADAARCLRRLPFERLTGIGQEKVFTVHREVAEMPWLPVAGTPALPLQPPDAMRLGVAARVPLLHGGTKDEMRPAVAATYDRTGNPVTAEDYPQILRDMFGPAKAKAILGQYPHDEYPSPSLALATLLTDYGGMLGACAQLPAADALARRAPVYLYEFAEPDGRPSDFPYGAAHGVDMPYFFTTPFQPPPTTGPQKELSTKLIGHWTQFAKTGTPGSGWASYKDGTTLQFTAERTRSIDLAAEHNCRFWRAIT
ncbi:carboxylesterase/lipase family protein [Actinomadura sp. 1N219]|uniref:carboxylesterase/lipase family protein n=1 Tax=Actinomadura sp. 1N219 TaxID=3375152 RepID=UPI0037BD980E